MTADRLPTCIGCDAEIGEMRDRYVYLSPPGVILIVAGGVSFYICPACGRDETRREHAMVRYESNRPSPFWPQR